MYGVIVEVQLRKDRDKEFSWPLYQAAFRARHRCPTCVLVVSPDRDVATWATQPITIGLANSVFTPLVVGPDLVPVVVEREEAVANPEVALLSVLAHGRGQDAERVGLAAIEAALRLTQEEAMVYLDLIFVAVADSVRRRLEEHMQSDRIPFQSEFARRYVEQGWKEGLKKGREEGLEQGLEEGLEQGLEQGLEEGLEQGLEQGLLALRAVLRDVLAERFADVDPDTDRRIAGATMPELASALKRAVRASDPADVFDPEAEPE